MSDDKIVIDSSDIERAKKTLRELTNQLDGFAGVAGKGSGAMKGLGTASVNAAQMVEMASLTIVAAAVALYSLANSSIEAADKMNDLSNRTNISTERLSLLDTMAQQAGSSVEELVGSAEKLGSKLAKQDEASGRAVTALKQLGISTKDANGETKSMLALQTEIVMAADKAADKSKAEGAAIQLLGTEYYKLKTPIKEAAENSEKMYDQMFKINSLVSKELAKNSDTYKDKVTELGKAFTGIGNSIAEASLPMMIRFENKLIEMANRAAVLVKQMSGSDKSYNIKQEIDKTYDDEAKAKAKIDLYKGRFGPNAEQETKRAQAVLDGLLARRMRLQDENKALIIASQQERQDVISGKAGEGGRPDGKPTKAKVGITETDEYKKASKHALENQERLRQEAAGIRQFYIDQELEERTARKKLAADVEKQNNETDKHITIIQEEAAATKIANQVMSKYGATTHDADLAVTDYLISQEKMKLAAIDITAATTLEANAIQNKIRVLEAHKASSAGKKVDTDNETERQRSFSYGWENAFTKYQQDATNSAHQVSGLFSAASQGMEDAMVKFAMTGKLSFSDMARSILADLARIAAKKMIAGLFGLAFSADGNAFGNTGILKSANGNVFDGPTLHGYSGGVGMLGEAGPEAVMPLKRNAAGQLGVVTQGGSGQTNNISVNVTVQGGSTNENTGNAVASKVAELFTRGIVRQELMAARRTGGMLNPV